MLILMALLASAADFEGSSTGWMPDDRVQLSMSAGLRIRESGSALDGLPLAARVRLGIPVASRTRIELAGWGAPLAPESSPAEVSRAFPPSVTRVFPDRYEASAGGSVQLARTIADGRVYLADEAGPRMRLDARLGLGAQRVRRAWHVPGEADDGGDVLRVFEHAVQPALVSGLGGRVQVARALDVGLDLGVEVFARPDERIGGRLTTTLGMVWVLGRGEEAS